MDAHATSDTAVEAGSDPLGELFAANPEHQPNTQLGPTEAGIRAMADSLVAAGKLTQAQADAMVASDLAEDGHAAAPTPHAASDPTWNELPPEFSAPANVADYRLPNNTTLPPSFDEMQLAGEAFHAANLPVGIAQSLFQRMSQVAAQKLTPDQIELQSRATMSKLESQYGAARAREMVGKAQALIRQVAQKHPGIIDILNGSGAGSDYAIVRQLSEHADRLIRVK